MRDWRIMDTVRRPCVHVHAREGCPCTQMPVGGCLAEWRGRRAQVEWAGVHHQPQTGMIATFAKLSIGLGWAINPCRSLGAVLPFLSRSLCSPAPCLRIWPAESEVLRDLVVQAKLLGEGCAEACDSHSHKGRACRAKHPHPSGLCNAPGVGCLGHDRLLQTAHSVRGRGSSVECGRLEPMRPDLSGVMMPVCDGVLKLRRVGRPIFMRACYLLLFPFLLFLSIAPSPSTPALPHTSCPFPHASLSPSPQAPAARRRTRVGYVGWTRAGPQRWLWCRRISHCLQHERGAKR